MESDQQESHGKQNKQKAAANNAWEPYFFAEQATNHTSNEPTIPTTKTSTTQNIQKADDKIKEWKIGHMETSEHIQKRLREQFAYWYKMH